MGSEPSSGCQVSAGRCLINRTFPLLNLGRIDGISGHGSLASCALAHEAVSWGHLPLQVFFRACQARLIEDRCSLLPWPVFPSRCPQPLSALLSPFPSMAGFRHHHFSSPEPQSGEMASFCLSASADPLHPAFPYELCARHSWLLWPLWRGNTPAWVCWGLAREEGEATGSCLRDTILWVPGPFVGWHPIPQGHGWPWCSSDSPGQSEAFLLVLDDTSQIHPLLSQL